MKRIEYFELPNGKRPCREWLYDLETNTKDKIISYVKRVAAGGTRKNIRVLCEGVYEIKIKFGPGYRVYFGEVGNIVLLLLVGGSKRTQFVDIVTAKKYWREYVQKRGV